MKQYDAIIIGFGKGGKLLAAELAERNWKVAIVERSPQMYGGTCVNVGCIPTKTLIHESEYAEKRYYDDYKNQSKLYALAVARKDKLVSFLREKNYENVKNKPNITLYDGTASFLSENTIRIVSGKDETILEGKEIFINTGSTPILPAIDGLKESKYVYTSETLLQSNKLPAHLLVIGGGAVGLEFATMYAGFGSHVTLLEAGNRFLPKVDRDIAASMLEALNQAYQCPVERPCPIRVRHSRRNNSDLYGQCKRHSLLPERRCLAGSHRPQAYDCRAESGKSGYTNRQAGSHRCRQPITDYSPTRMGPGGRKRRRTVRLLVHR